MCMANAYLENVGKEEIVFEKVATLRVADKEVILEGLFGEKKTVPAEIKEIDFANSRILLKGREQ